MKDLKEEWDIKDDERYALRVEKEIIEEECDKMQDKLAYLQQNMFEIEAKFDAQATKLFEIDAN